MQAVYPLLHWRVRMQGITLWNGGHAAAPRQALRMTNESFAEHVSVATRTVAYWRKNPGITPKPAVQETLDAPLEQAPDREKAQFAALIDQAGNGKGPDSVDPFDLPGKALLGSSPGVDPEFGDSSYLQS